MSVGQNPPFALINSYIFSTSSGSTTEAISAPGTDTAVISNQSTANLYVAFGAVTISASVGAGYCIPANSQRVVDFPAKAAWTAFILDASTTGKVYFEFGRGSAH